MIFEPFKPFTASEFQVKFATDPWERAGALALRRDVFCSEQGLFDRSDIDAIDGHAIPIVALSMLGVAADRVVGTVRIHEAEDGLWWGSRLAVAADYRKVGALGTSLIRLAVCSAHARGCRRFLAHVQEQNVLLFRRLHWRSVEEIELHGRRHHLMAADLDHYRPIANAEQGFVALARKAA
ncbi:MSMEG_0567/Sll0786 family nitrogen starvation N-acetyltransferase [Labrys monachus]|uniref:N-acetyltransferase (TIGR04045 family) n=1 Tax=Labrys monachus TaxID=217067 RepID=A0ABU0FBW1_9HYPH|nr:MSMEG_0567/Sll0786 family nitrogen starvation N-acetyltransferase [Labrys monachus]MDQ0392094.1 putative N-acetyltransferase (TIGR04045 family) [Labrys monachus]